MTAREKFIARLEELGLYEEWKSSGAMAGKVLDDGSIVILVHYEYDNDPYDELRYPPFEELWKNESFRNECKQDFYCHEDDHFVAELAYWLDIHTNGAKCPLFPVDVYFPASGLETEVIEFKDDPKAPDPERLTNIIRELAEMCGIDLA